MACTSNCLQLEIWSCQSNYKLMILIYLITSIMGNCMDVLLYSREKKIKVLIFNGGEKEFNASTPVEMITSGPYNDFKLVHHAQPYSPLPPNTMLEPGEVYYLVPLLAQPHYPQISSKTADHETCKRRKIKIVVTKKQLDLLLRSTKKFQSEYISVQSLGGFRVGEGYRKWQPSLAIIPEVHSF